MLIVERSKAFGWNLHSVVCSYPLESQLIPGPFLPGPWNFKVPIVPFVQFVLAFLSFETPAFFLGVYEGYSLSPWQLLAGCQCDLMSDWRQGQHRPAVLCEDSLWTQGGRGLHGEPRPMNSGGLGVLGCPFPEVAVVLISSHPLPRSTLSPLFK